MHKIISRANKNLFGSIALPSSKSISNRVLIINALCGDKISINNLSQAQDTQTLCDLLAQKTGTYDVGAAGTTFRFLTAFFAFQAGTQVLTGSSRMKERPIGVLVDALRKLGANINYLENEGFPPLQINAPSLEKASTALSVPANVSSQFVSALLMIAPTLPNGLQLTLEGTVVSQPYIDMTLKLMQHFGIVYEIKEQTICIAQQTYQSRDFWVESDWSAASYFYAMAAMADEADIFLAGLQKNSLQGDAIIAKMLEKWGVQSEFSREGVRLVKKNAEPPKIFDYNFLQSPDLAQTMAVLCSATGTMGIFSGLETLKVKETDRIEALKTELKKVNTFFTKIPPHYSKKSNSMQYLLEGAADFSSFVADDPPTFETYHDHRMAMSFAMLAMLHPLKILDAAVVAKSFPSFWEALGKIEFVIKNG